MPRMNLEGSSSIVTGGASGIGEASARLLTEAFEHASEGEAEEFAAQLMESHGDPSERNEVLS